MTKNQIYGTDLHLFQKLKNECFDYVAVFKKISTLFMSVICRFKPAESLEKPYLVTGFWK